MNFATITPVMTKYIRDSAAIAYGLSVVSALLLGYWDLWVSLVAILALATFVIWRRVAQDQDKC